MHTHTTTAVEQLDLLCDEVICRLRLDPHASPQALADALEAPLHTVRIALARLVRAGLISDSRACRWPQADSQPKVAA